MRSSDSPSGTLGGRMPGTKYPACRSWAAACIVLAARQRRAVVIVDSALAGGVCGHELRQACHCETIPIIALLPASKNFEMQLKAELVHIFGGQTFSEAA